MVSKPAGCERPNVIGPIAVPFHSPTTERLLESQYPGIKFNWKTIHSEIEKRLAVLPETYEYRKPRTTDQFYPSLCSFAKNLLLADPQRIGRKMYWADHATRPYMRGLMNLSYAFMAERRFDEALGLCDKLKEECSDAEFAHQARGRIFLNRGDWAAASEAAGKVHRGQPIESFVMAFASYELGQHLDALTHFVFAALNKPHAARILTDVRSNKPDTPNRVDDHNSGVDLFKTTRWFRERQSHASTKFFKDVMRDARVVAFLRHVEELDPSGPKQKPEEIREAYRKHDGATSWTAAQEHAARLIDRIAAKRDVKANPGRASWAIVN